MNPVPPIVQGMSCPCHQTWLQWYNSPRCTHCGFNLEDTKKYLDTEKAAKEMGWP